MRYFLYIAYDGGAYHGWQTQPNASSVQQTIEESIEVVLRRPVPIVGAGRTDTGVHAKLMVVHLDLDIEVGEARDFFYRLDRFLPPDIALYRFAPMREDAHARFSAISRTYRYYVSEVKSPFNRGGFLRLHSRVDYDKMNEAASYLLGTKDFTSFSKLHTDVKTNICSVTEAYWVAHPRGDGSVFCISANRFLRNMVRAITGTLLQVGRGKLSVGDFVDILQAQDRCRAGSSAPAHALYLEDIVYPQDLFLINPLDISSLYVD